MKALGIVVSDKKIFESFILKTYLLTPWPTYATNWNGMGPPRDHSCEVWSKSNKWFQRRCCLMKLLTHARMMDDGQWAITIAHLRWANKKIKTQNLYRIKKINKKPHRAVGHRRSPLWEGQPDISIWDMLKLVLIWFAVSASKIAVLKQKILFWCNSM